MKKVILLWLTTFVGTGYGHTSTWNILPDKSRYEVTGAVKTIKQCFLDKEQLKKVKDLQDSNCDWQVINHFNIDGNLTMRNFISRNYRLEYTYKSDNDLTRIDFYDTENLPTHVILPVKTTTNDEGTRRIVRYPRDFRHHLYDVVPVEKASLGQLDEKEPVQREYQYDSEGQLIDTSYYSFYVDHLSAVEKHLPSYDENHRITSIIYQDRYGFKPMNFFTYDDRNVLISEGHSEYSSSNDNPTAYKNQFSYDDQSNWVSLKQFRDKKLVGITLREIEYYSQDNQELKQEAEK